MEEVLGKIKESQIPKWSEVRKQFIGYCSNAGLSLGTIENRNLCLNAHTNQWDNLTIDKISSMNIRDVIIEKLKARSPSQKQNVLKYIRLCFEFACEKNYISRNPTPKMKFKIGDKVKKVLTEGQIRVFLNQAKLMAVEWYPLWCGAIYTGMRNGELYALTWDKVNFEDRKIIVDCSWDNKKGFKSTKSGDERVVEIAHILLPILKELRLKSMGETNFVFPRIDQWDKGEQARALRMFLLGLGLPQIRFHDLRACWATIMLSKGAPAIKVMRMGGWKDMKTMHHYMRMAGVDIEGITDVLNLHDAIEVQADIIKFE